MGSRFPKELRYLTETLQNLEDQDALNEHTDTSALRQALITRIGGMPEERAQKRLDDDLEMLERWLEDSDDELAAAHFVLGYMMMPSLARELLASQEDDDAD